MAEIDLNLAQTVWDIEDDGEFGVTLTALLVATRFDRQRFIEVFKDTDRSPDDIERMYLTLLEGVPLTIRSLGFREFTELITPLRFNWEVILA
jgi:hypothetical protein